MGGILSFVVYLLTTTAIYSILTLGLNVHWGFTGLLNIGIAGFFALGAYVSIYVTHGIGLAGRTMGLGLPFPLAFLGAMIFSGVVAYLLGTPTLKLRKGYFAVTLLGFAEIVRLIAANEEWLTNGSMGISNIYQPLSNVFSGSFYPYFYLALVILSLYLFYIALNRIHKSPWGRAMRAIRENENVTMMQGKNTFKFKLKGFIVGAALMGGAGSLLAHYFTFINPSYFTSTITFMVWIMLIVGGSGNNLGALVGSFIIWGFWVASNFLLDFVPAGLIARFGSIRIMLIASFFIYVLINRPQGLLPEKKWVSSLFD